MHKVFLYDDRLDLGAGKFASVVGFKLVAEGLSQCPEAVRSKAGIIYGEIYEVSQGTLEMMDAYYGLGVNLHERIEVKVSLAGGTKVKVFMYEYNLELV